MLHSGRMAQAGTPADVYAAPDDLTVARLTGPLSVLDARVSARAQARSTIEVGEARATVPCAAAPGAEPAAAAVLVRPDWARLADSGGPGGLGGGDLPGAITEVRFRGPHTDYHVATPAGTLLVREAGPPRAGCGPVRWTLLRARLMPRERPGGPPSG